MAGHRPERVAQLLQQAITEMLQRGKIKDPRVGEATVAEVKVTVDLRIAKVYVQVLGGAEAAKRRSRVCRRRSRSSGTSSARSSR